MEQRPQGTYGFVGAGAIAAAIVEGLHAGDGAAPAVLLSPRGREVGRDLAGRFPGVRVCGSNQEVLDGAPTVVVAVRPQDARAVLAGLSFRPEHAVVSVMAGVPLDRLREWAAPAGQVVRAIPLPSAARRASLTAVHPDHGVARELFGRVGDVLATGDEATLDALSAATGTFAAHLDHLATIVGWLTDQGMDRDAATAYTTHIYGQLGQSLLAHSDPLRTLTDEHMTAGGLNMQFMTELRRQGVPDVVRGALDGLLARLRA